MVMFWVGFTLTASGLVGTESGDAGSKFVFSAEDSMLADVVSGEDGGMTISGISGSQ